MFCSSCGSSNDTGAGFCAKCGTAVGSSGAPSVAVKFSPPTPSSPGSTFSTVGIICGAVAFLFIPVLFGPAGLILGAIAKSKGEEKAVIALVVSGLGLVVGMFLGAVVFSSL